MEKCQTEMFDLAHEFRSEFDEQIANNEREITKIKSDYLEIKGTTNRDFVEFYNRIWEKQRIDSLVMNHYERFFNAIMAIPSDKKKRASCEDPGIVEDNIENKIDKIETRLESFQEAVRHRAELEDLDKDEGLVLIAAYSNSYGDLRIDGPDGFKFWMSGTPYIKMHKLEKGNYNFLRFQWYQSDSSFHYYDFDEDNFSFEVEAGELNLSGVFKFEELRNKGTWELYDRSSMLLEILENEFPILMRKYEWNNGVNKHNNFIDFYRAQFHMEVK
ncbi:MAG: hypothetical protein ACFHVJ_17205 [Aestuariibacter sp.]